MRGLAARCPEKLVVFADNCSIHKSKLITAVMKELDIVPIWNLPYRYVYLAKYLAPLID